MGAPLEGAWTALSAERDGRPADELRGHALDTLTIADNAPDLTRPRPAALSAGPGSGYVLLVFERAASRP